MSVGVQIPPAAAAGMLGNYGPLLAYAPTAAGHSSAVISPTGGTILFAAAAPSASLCTVLLVSNLNEEVRFSTCQ